MGENEELNKKDEDKAKQNLLKINEIFQLTFSYPFPTRNFIYLVIDDDCILLEDKGKDYIDDF